MFIDRILNNWEYVTQNYRTDKTLHAIFGNNAPSWDDVKMVLNRSVVFDVSNVNQYLESIVGKGGSINIFHDCPNVRPPFQTMWFEFSQHFTALSYPSHKERIVTKVGILYDSYENEPEGYVLFSALPFLEYSDSEFNVGCAMQGGCDLEGALYPQANDLGGFIPNYINTITPIMTRAFLSISFMHCKNVTLNKIDIPVKLEKARERENRRPLFSYHVLEIKPMVKILKEEGQSDTQGLKRALHICRGHFKDFSKGGGLFGKYKGLYWWEPQVRGNITEGIALKDYKVTPKETRRN